MNVLQVLPELEAGGVERTTIEMCEALTRAGHGAFVVCAGGRMEAALSDAGGQLHRLDIGTKNPLHYRKNVRNLIDIIRSENIDIVHARSRAPAWPAYAAAQKTGAHFVTTYHGIYNARSNLKRRYNAIMAKGQIVIANSEYTKSHIIREHATPSDKIAVIPRGVDMAVFDPKNISNEDIQRQRSDWDIPEGAYVILLPGRLTRWKGQLVAIRALEKLQSNVHLVLLGDAQGRSDYVAEIRNLTKNLNLSERVRIPGHSDSMPAALSAADLVISASTDPEAFGRVLAEAQAMMRPVIGTSHGGAMETVLEQETGLLVPPNDPVALADAVQSVRNWRAYNGAIARDRIGLHYSKAQLQEKTLAVYTQLLL